MGNIDNFDLIAELMFVNCEYQFFAAITGVGVRGCSTDEIAEILRIIFNNKDNPEVIPQKLSILCNNHINTIKQIEGNKKLEERFRKSVNYRSESKLRSWRNKVIKRDNYTCQKCGQVGGDIEAHHIELYSKNIEKRYDIDNGITLCKKCHRGEHKRR